MSQIYEPPSGRNLTGRVLPTLGLTITEAAKQLGVTCASLSRVLNGKAAMSPQMALRIESWLGVENGGSADIWIAEQVAYDLWQARQAGAPLVQRAAIPHNN